MNELAATVTFVEANRRAADSRRDEAAPEVLARIRSAYEVFDSQSLLLQSAFDNLKRNLAEANRQLQRSNQALSEKVAELEQMSSRMHCILESLGDAVLVVNCSGRIERSNPAAAQLLGCHRSDVEGRDYVAAMASSGLPAVIAFCPIESNAKKTLSSAGYFSMNCFMRSVTASGFWAAAASWARMKYV